jgi:transcriptional regulator with XRE-family HTH domain
MRALDVGGRIRGIRKNLGLTQAQFAKRLGVTKVSVARYEAGRVPRLNVLKEIARVGGVTVTWLLDGSSQQGHQRQLQAGPQETGLIEPGHDLLTFLQQKAPLMTHLPAQYRKRFEERIRELVARAKRELDEYQKVLEGESRRRRKRS